MEDFVNFIIDYIEKTEIHGRTGWIDQLAGYQWKRECFSDGIQTSKNLNSKTHDVLKTPNSEGWNCHCNQIAKWGGMPDVSLGLATRYRESVNYLLNNDPVPKSNFRLLPICGKRIATASKIYYFSDPLRWTIFDSRVGYAIHQLIFEYSKKVGVEPLSLFQEIPLCLPDSQTCLPHSKTKKRTRIYDIPICGHETRAKASFVWASHLHRLIATKLNVTSIPKPPEYLSTVSQWELPHIEMIFFMIGDRKWVDAPYFCPRPKIRKRS